MELALVHHESLVIGGASLLRVLRHRRLGRAVEGPDQMLRPVLRQDGIRALLNAGATLAKLSRLLLLLHGQVVEARGRVKLQLAKAIPVWIFHRSLLRLVERVAAVLIRRPTGSRRLVVILDV